MSSSERLGRSNLQPTRVNAGLSIALAVAALSTARTARAEPAYGTRAAASVEGEVDPNRERAEVDGAYGRFDGDLDLGIGVGALVDLEHGELGFGARLSAHWFFMAGVYASYGDGLGGDQEPARRLGVGVDLRPLFLPRWTQNWEQGPAVLDLTLDSLSLALGASFDEPVARGFGVRRAFEASLGFGVPLAGSGPGPWLESRAALAWPNFGERSETLLVLFTWHFAQRTPLVADE